jgi:hypothetical protein
MHQMLRETPFVKVRARRALEQANLPAPNAPNAPNADLT